MPPRGRQVPMDVLLGRALRQRREDRGFTRAQLGPLATLSPSTVERIESGWVSVTMESLRRMCEVLDCAPWEVMQEAQSEETLREARESMARRWRRRTAS